MSVPENFAAFILTHGRPNRVDTYRSLRKHGYTGRIVIVIDNEDATRAEYEKKFGDAVVVFDKAGVAAQIDECDNFGDRRAIIYARNACFEIARQIGVEFFIQLDDDYTQFMHKRNGAQAYEERSIKDLDSVLCLMLEYFKSSPAVTLAMAQTGDYIGGNESPMAFKPILRKAMNSFLCSTSRPFKFLGRINEDVNTYTSEGSRGLLFLTFTEVALRQRRTQANAGGMTELYLDSGTYVKSFYTIIVQPSSVRIALMNTIGARIHHKIEWRNTVPCILREQWRK